MGVDAQSRRNPDDGTGSESPGQGAVLHALANAVAQGNITDARSDEFAEVRDVLTGFSRSRALQGFSPTETATFVFSLKRAAVRAHPLNGASAKAAADQLWAMSSLLDQLGMFTVEMPTRRRATS